LASRPHTGPSSVCTGVLAVHAGAAGAAGAAATAVRDAASATVTATATVTAAIDVAAQRNFLDLLPICLMLILLYLRWELCGFVRARGCCGGCWSE
jgi:hypothetical protein